MHTVLKIMKAIIKKQKGMERFKGSFCYANKANQKNFRLR